VAKVLAIRDGSGHPLEGSVPEVGWRDRALTFRFSALSYLNEARVRYQVRLMGFEDSWRSTETREARYTGLPPGRFQFEVRASLGPGEFGPADLQEVIILAPWWRTGWALSLAIAGFAGLLTLLYRWRVGWLHRRNALLEALVHSRTGELEEANLALQAASMVDPLTGLKNRRFLDISMPEELARLSRQRRRLDGPDRSSGNANMDLLFFMMDLDHFKSVNDSYGHAAGDLVLRQASEAIRLACREADMVVRWGGEEFLIVARNTDRSAAALMAKKLWSSIREFTFDVGHGVALRKTCSIGFSAFPVIDGSPNLFTWEEAIELADHCLYAAKNSGRDAWVGVLVSDAASAEGARILQDPAGLAAEGKAQILTSFPPDTILRWNTE
jgi:diguanylate cyclase (GGDEF)-like protein